MKEGNLKTIHERMDTMLRERRRAGLSARRSALKAAWERLSPAEEWASQRPFRLRADPRAVS